MGKEAMAKLKSRDKFTPLPGGFPFLQAETNWTAPSGSFESVVQAIISHRRGNPHLMTVHGWSIDPETVRNELDSYCARFCKQLGYTDYINEGAPEPPPNPTTPQPVSSLAGKLAAGSETLIEWLGEGGNPVDKALAEKRAAICVTCSQNNMEDFSRWFTGPVSQAIRYQIQRKQEMKLETQYDERLGTCAICLCPMRLKVWTPLHNINNNMLADVKAALPEHCWVKRQDHI